MTMSAKMLSDDFDEGERLRKQSQSIGDDAQGARSPFSASTRRRCEMALAALREASFSADWATGRALSEAWRRVHGEAPPPDVAGRWSRVFDPALRSGEARVGTLGRSQVYGLGAVHGEPAGGPLSDLAKVEIALARAVARTGGAVPVERIAEEIEADPNLTLTTANTPLASRVIRLRTTGRIERVKSPSRESGRRWYYLPCGSSRRVAPSAELPLDRRVRAIRALSRLSGGRPFTTRAVANYASARESFAVRDDTAYGWTNALQYLAASGILTKVDEGRDPWFVLWAPTEEWERLTEAERSDRLRDPYQREALRVTTENYPLERGTNALNDVANRGGDLSSGGHCGDTSNRRETESTAAAMVAPNESLPHVPLRVDTHIISRNRNCAALVQAAQRWQASDLDNPDAKARHERRPVTVKQVEHVRRAHPHLVPRRTTLFRALHEATRVRDEMRRSAVVHMGTVRNVSYFASEDTPDGRAYVAFVAALAEADTKWLAASAATLYTDADRSSSGINPLPKAVLIARASAIIREVSSNRAAIQESQSQAPLEADEEARGQAAVDKLGEIERLAAGATASIVGDDDVCEEAAQEGSSDAHRAKLPMSMLIDVAEAAKQFRGLIDYRMSSARALWARVPNAVRVFRIPDYAVAPSRGRKAANFMDRVGFALWVARRLGGPQLGGLSGQAHALLGDLRDSLIVVRALLTDAPVVCHTSLCAALAFLDDEHSRDALVAYLAGATPGISPSPKWAKYSGMSVATRTHPAAVATAIYGLAKLPCGGCASVLRDSERAVLVALSTHGPTAFARLVARRVIQSWDEHWSSEQLLHL